MPFATGTSNTLNDLFSQLRTFATGLGWTSDRFSNSAGEATGVQSGQLFLSKGNLFTSFAHNQSLGGFVAHYHATGYDAGQAEPDDQPGALGGGPDGHPTSSWDTYNNTTTRNRFIREMGLGPFSYFFFGATDGVGEQYIHAVVEVTPGEYRHFGFGNMEKSWNWTGGEYVYSHPVSQNGNNPEHQQILFPSVTTTTGTARAAFGGSLRCTGLPGQPANSKYGTSNDWSSFTTNNTDNDGDFLVFVHGSAPGGKIGSNFVNMPSGAGDGFLPLVPNAIFYRDITPTPNRDYLLGFQPDVRCMNMANFEPQDTFTVGADTWQVFPSVLKQNTNLSTEESENLGIAYRRFA